MLEKLADFFVSQPTRLILLGDLLLRIAAADLMVGLIGHVAAVGTSALASFGAHASVAPMLAELYPNLPTGLVPESAFGFIATSVIGVLSLTAIQIGKKLRRMIG